MTNPLVGRTLSTCLPPHLARPLSWGRRTAPSAREGWPLLLLLTAISFTFSTGRLWPGGPAPSGLLWHSLSGSSLFHFNYPTLSAGVASSCLRVTGSFLSSFVDARLSSLLTGVLKPLLITALQFKVTRNLLQQDFSTTSKNLSFSGS